jgi:hypothetical protein
MHFWAFVAFTLTVAVTHARAAVGITKGSLGAWWDTWSASPPLGSVILTFNFKLAFRSRELSRLLHGGIYFGCCHDGAG